jgi:hypothetical protein
MTAPIKGDHYRWGVLSVTITRVAKDGKWADILVRHGNSEWGKRQRLPFPPTFVQDTFTKETAS